MGKRKIYRGQYTCDEIVRILQEAQQTKADTYYIAMMCDIDITTDGEDKDDEQISDSQAVF